MIVRVIFVKQDIQEVEKQLMFDKIINEHVSFFCTISQMGYLLPTNHLV